ncbi:MAG: DUF2007 domain-containing protein [Rhodocyclaceae bacterium]
MSNHDTLTRTRELRAQLAQMDDNDLLARWQQGEFADWARAAAEGEWRARGLDAGAFGAAAQDDQAEDETGQDMRTVFRAHSPTEAHTIQAFLAGSGIPAVVPDAHLAHVQPLYGIALGWIRVQVPIDQSDAALELIRQFHAGHLALDDTAPEAWQAETDSPADPPAQPPDMNTARWIAGLYTGCRVALFLGMASLFWPAQPMVASVLILSAALFGYIILVLLSGRPRPDRLMLIYFGANLLLAVGSTSIGLTLLDILLIAYITRRTAQVRDAQRGAQKSLPPAE